MHSVVKNSKPLVDEEASAHSVVKKCSNRREHRENTEKNSVHSVVKNLEPLVDEEASAHSVVK